MALLISSVGAEQRVENQQKENISGCNWLNFGFRILKPKAEAVQYTFCTWKTAGNPIIVEVYSYVPTELVGWQRQLGKGSLLKVEAGKKKTNCIYSKRAAIA